MFLFFYAIVPIYFYLFQTKFGGNVVQKPREISEIRHDDYEFYRSRISIADKSQRHY